MKTPFFRHLSAIALCLCTTTAFAAQAPSRTECIAPAKPGGGFDLTCKL
ncbi:tricarboxylic transporter, partial [Klebsiella aerogenes]